MTIENLYTERDLATRFQISVLTVRRWRAEKIGPDYTLIGAHTVRYREQDVKAYEESRIVQHGASAVQS